MIAQAFRLIPRERPTAKILQSEPADPVGAFTQLADQIQRRDHCHRVEALQRAIDETAGAPISSWVPQRRLERVQ